MNICWLYHCLEHFHKRAHPSRPAGQNLDSSVNRTCSHSASTECVYQWANSRPFLQWHTMSIGACASILLFRQSYWQTVQALTVLFRAVLTRAAIISEIYSHQWMLGRRGNTGWVGSLPALCEITAVYGSTADFTLLMLVSSPPCSGQKWCVVNVGVVWRRGNGGMVLKEMGIAVSIFTLLASNNVISGKSPHVISSSCISIFTRSYGQ